MSQHISSPQFDTDNGGTRVPSVFHSKVMVGAIIVLFLVIFFILMLHVYAKWFFQRSSRSYTITRRISFLSLNANAAASAHIDLGLDKASIAQLPTFVYKATSHFEDGKLDASVARPSLECAVCLSEFQENEKGRMLPSCKHTFHTDCIDMWFFSHSTCPLCRTEVVPAMATSPNTASTHEQQHEGEEQDAMQPLTGTEEGNAVVSNAVEYPGNVLLSGNQKQVILSQEPSSSSLPRSLRMSGARALPQITIDINLVEGNMLVSAPAGGELSAKCTIDQQEACCSSEPLKSPGLRASIKRMLSRQSSRQKSSSEEGYEGLPN